MKRLLAVLAIVGVGLLGQVTPAAAATGSQSFTIYAVNSDVGTVFASGPVSGSGTATTIDEDHDVFAFVNGTFVVFHPETGSSDNFNPVSCTFSSRFEGTYTLSGGTGAYAGISGSGTYSGRAFGYGLRSASGECSEEPVFFFFLVTASGTTTLP